MFIKHFLKMKKNNKVVNSKLQKNKKNKFNHCLKI